MKLSSFRSALSVIIFLAASVSFVACNKSDNGTTTNPPVSGLMAFNLASDKAVNIALSGNSITNLPLAFTNYTGSYLSIYSGSRLVQTFDYNSGSSLDSSTVNFEPQKYYSLFVTGANGHYRNVIVNDNFDSLPAGQAYIRYINAIPDSSVSTVSVTANGENVINNSASFASVSNFAAVAPGQVSIQINNGGTINKSRTITLEQQKAYTILFAGVPSSTGNDSLQIRFVTNGTLQQKTQKVSTPASSVNSN